MVVCYSELCCIKRIQARDNVQGCRFDSLSFSIYLYLSHWVELSWHISAALHGLGKHRAIMLIN